MKKRLLPFAFFVLLTHLSFTQVIFVDGAAAGGNTGTSWEDAFTDLQDALNAAPAGSEIWVAAGTYKPDVMNGSPSSTFLINNNLYLLGGFNGMETTADQRDPENNLTILSGDLNGDDVDDNFVNFKSDNVMTVVTIASNITNATLVDGFTVEGGQADGLGTGSQTNGAGIYCLGAPAFRNCIFKQNFASLNGGAISLNYSVAEEVVFENCRFEKNRADYGGGVFIKPSQPTDHQTVSLIDCVFEKNKATLGHGGGVYYLPNGDSTTFAMTGCDFIGNKARLAGGGFAHWNPFNHYKALKMTIDSCHFSQDTIENDLGSAILLYSSARDMDFTLSNSNFEDNFTEAYGTVILWGTVGGTGVMTVENCLFENNRAGYSAGLDIGNDYDAGYYEYNVINCDFIGNEATGFCGGLDIWTYSSATIRVERCTMLENKAGTWGGGMMVWMHGWNASATVSNCVIENNESSFGAAVGTYPEFSEPWGPVNDSTTFINCLITGNIGEGATIATNPHGNLILLNCTVAENPADGILLNPNSAITLQNTILYNPGEIEFQNPTGTATFTSHGGNLIRDTSLDGQLTLSDKHNLDPLFGNNFQLTEDSPCVDAGVDVGVMATLDLDGNPRIQGLRVDMGAYESPFITTSTVEVRERDLAVSPNPSADFLNINLPDDTTDPLNVQVFDVQGRLLLHETLSIGMPLNLTGLHSGMYSLKVVVGKQVFAGKFIKQ